MTKHNGKEPRPLVVEEFKQMAGRAGRRGIDTIGNVIYFPIHDPLSISEMETMMLGSIRKISSKFSVSTQYVLRSLMSQDGEPSSILDLTRQTLMQKENLHMETGCVGQRDECTRELETIETRILETDPEGALSQLYDTIHTYRLAINSNIRPKGRKGCVASLRQAELEVSQLSKSDRVRYDSIVKLGGHKVALKVRLAELDADIQNIPGALERDMQLCVDFLSRRGYMLADSSTTIHELRKSHLTTKGIFANYLNQCHEIMITEAMLTRKLADAFMHDPPNLAAWLAVYIDENCAKEDAVAGATDLGLDAIACGEEVHDELVRIGLSDGAGEFKLSTKYVDPVWEWCQGAHLQTVCQTYDIFEGNMVRALQKLINLIDELKSAFDAINGVEWVNALETTKTLIRRDVLQVDSIYLTS